MLRLSPTERNVDAERAAKAARPTTAATAHRATAQPTRADCMPVFSDGDGNAGG